jgi:MOSC domain-containing protein YiiM
MQLISINVGQERTLIRPNKSEQTGIFKHPVEEKVRITRNGIPGDFIGDSKNHGGPDQAIYVYGMTDYGWWSKELGVDLAPGTFGDNFTISGLASAKFSIGDRLIVGPVILEVTAPRIPCGTLAGRMQIPDFVKQFRFAERPGLYCRVIQEGTIEVGIPVLIESYNDETITLIEMFRDFYEPAQTEAGIRRILNAPIDIRTRIEKEKQLNDLLDKDSL